MAVALDYSGYVLIKVLFPSWMDDTFAVFYGKYNLDVNLSKCAWHNNLLGLRFDIDLQ